MKLLRLLVISIVGFAVIFFSYRIFPDRYRYEISDWFGRINAPNFDLPPDAIVQTDQASLIGEYQRRGYDLKCYGNLRPEEKISKTDDYECWTLVKSAYDDIQAKMVVFFFSKGELSHVRIEFPESSFGKLENYLNRRLANYPRLDQMPGSSFGADIYGKPLMVWGVKEGVVVTSASVTPGQPITLLWSKLH